jgi:hypothetical protein
MEKRKSERVQFFQLPRDKDLMPVWVFRRDHPDNVLGLLLDIGAEGAQVFTDKSSPLKADAFRLIVHADETGGSQSVSLCVRRLWSKPEGNLYIRNGFTFEAGEDATSSIEQVLAARDAGNQWLRCELAAA